MNLEQAVHTITKRGFTDRQARFLILVARHSGVCVMRQYSSFAGIVFGQKTRKFFTNLVRLGLVSTYDCAHNRGRVFHVCHRATYEAIGEPDSRRRRPPACLAHSNGSCFWTPSWRTRTASGCRPAPRRSTTSRGAESRATIVRIGPSTKAINGSFATSRIACRSVFIHRPRRLRLPVCRPTA